MVFSFFKKGKADEPTRAGEKMPAPKPAAPAVPVRAAAPEPAVAEEPVDQLTTMIGDLPSLGGMLVEESGFDDSGVARALSPVAEEAAIYFANNKPLDAIRVLGEWVKQPEAKDDVQPWYMLFDLYQLSGMQQAFDELCIHFVEVFLCSPPLWRGKKVEKAAPVAAPVANKASNYLALTGVISVDSKPQIEQMRQILEKQGELQLDVSKIQALESSGSALLLQTFQKFRRGGARVQLGGTGNLIGLLKKQTQEAGPAEHWLLLMEIYQLLGREADFEELAIEYAVTLEVSPPSWEAVATRMTAVDSEPAAAEVEQEKPADVFHPQGEIAGNIQPVLQAFRAYVEAHQQVVVDLADVTRVDFVSVGDLMNELMALMANGKQANLLNVNELIIALFQTMGLDDFVVMHRAKDRTARAKKCV